MHLEDWKALDSSERSCPLQTLCTKSQSCPRQPRFFFFLSATKSRSETSFTLCLSSKSYWLSHPCNLRKTHWFNTANNPPLNLSSYLRPTPKIKPLLSPSPLLNRSLGRLKSFQYAGSLCLSSTGEIMCGMRGKKFYLLNSKEKAMHPTPVLLPGKSHGQRSLVGCHLWGRRESDTTEAT